MEELVLKAPESTKWDCVSLGEVMLRLDPGEGRIHTARTFTAWEGGGEYNVARGLRRCFGLRTAVVTALAENPVGRLVEDLMLQGGVDTSLLRWLPYDGVGRAVRNGLNFTERGFGVRAAVGCSDRGNTAVSQLKPGDIDWGAIFGAGVRWFHTGGIFAALSSTSAAVCAEAIQAARSHGTVTSYDLNYRESLWKGIGGKQKAQELNREMVRHLDVLFGNEEDFSAMLGIELEGVAGDFEDLPVPAYAKMLRDVSVAYPEPQDDRHHSANGEDRLPQRLGSNGALQGRNRSCAAAGSRHPGPRRRRRFVRLRADLRSVGGEAPAVGCGVRGSAWRAGHDDPRGYQYGNAG